MRFQFGALVFQQLLSLRRKFIQLRYEEDPTVIIEELVGLAQDAAGVKLARQPPVLRSGYSRSD